MTESPTQTPPPTRDWKGISLVVAFAGLVAAALWVQWDITREASGHPARARVDRVESIVLLLLLGVVGISLLTLWRLARRVREEAAQRRGVVQKLRESEAKYRSIFDNAIEGMFQTTPEGRFITANKALARLYGYKSPEHLMESLSDISTQLYVDPAQREALLEALREEDVVSNFEFEVHRADGRIIWLRENVRAVRDASGALLYLEGTVEDVSAHWWGEQRRRLQYATTRVLGEAASVAEARPKILQNICEILEWDLGAVWDVDRADVVLRCVEIWHSPDVDVAEFERANTSTTYPLGQGLAGDVWRHGEPKWIANLAEEAGFANAAIAVKAGMGSAFGVPIKVSGEVRHVLEFFSPKISLPDPELLQTLSAIGNQLGHLIERKNAEELLRQSEMRKAAILSSALDCIISFDEAGCILEFNPAAEHTFGYRQADVLGRALIEVIIPEPQRVGKLGALGLDATADDSNPTLGRRLELVVMRSDRTEFPAEIALSHIVIQGRPLFTAYLRDISERQAAQRVVSELAAVVANSNDAILACTLDGAIRSWNQGAERIFGYRADEAVGRPLHMLFPPDRLDEFAQMLHAVQRGESLANYETIRIRKDGRRISVSLTDSPIRGEGGTINGLSSIARDITERKRLEEELLQSQKMEAVGRLAGGIAHDFNNILTAILGYSDLMIRQVEEKHWMYKHLAEIRKAADFASSLTHQLLAFSRRQPLYLRVFNVNDSVRNMQKMLQRVIGEHIHVRTELAAGIGLLKADPSQLEQVLLNLCVNSRDALTQGGTITIATADVTYMLDDVYSVNEMPAGEYVKLCVADNGAGIPPDVVTHIFEPFFTTKEKGQGTGLGLATCYGIIKQTGGYIDVESNVGVGTTIAIYFPRVEESGEKAASRNEAGLLPGGSETILYVEDEITVRSLTAHVLRQLGYTVLEAADGRQARELMATTAIPIDLLFSDVVLPDLGGRQLSDWVISQHSTARILFCSGYVDENILRRHGLEIGTAFLQKPFTPADLARKVREVIDASN
jgi:PAS domain S-box-containing protein